MKTQTQAQAKAHKINLVKIYADAGLFLLAVEILRSLRKDDYKTAVAPLTDLQEYQILGALQQAEEFIWVVTPSGVEPTAKKGHGKNYWDALEDYNGQYVSCTSCGE